MTLHKMPASSYVNLIARESVARDFAQIKKYWALVFVLLVLPCLASGGPEHGARQIANGAEKRSHSLELSRSVRYWEFVSIVGKRAALLGNTSGRMEAWVYPLK